MDKSDFDMKKAMYILVGMILALSLAACAKKRGTQ